MRRHKSEQYSFPTLDCFRKENKKTGVAFFEIKTIQKEIKKKVTIESLNLTAEREKERKHSHTRKCIFVQRESSMKELQQTVKEWQDQTCRDKT